MSPATIVPTPAVPPSAAPPAASTTSIVMRTRAVSRRNTEDNPIITASIAAAPKAARTTRAPPSAIMWVPSTSTVSRRTNPPGVGTSIVGTNGLSSSTHRPNIRGTDSVPGPTGARMIAARVRSKMPFAAVTTPKGVPVSEAIPSSKTKRGLLPRAVAVISRYM